MNSSECTRIIAALRQQIETGPPPDLANYEPRLREAISLLEEISRFEAISPPVTAHVAQVKQSLRDFYNPQFSRSWTQRFVAMDLQALEDVINGEQNQEDSPRFAA